MQGMVGERETRAVDNDKCYRNNIIFVWPRTSAGSFNITTRRLEWLYAFG